MKTSDFDYSLPQELVAQTPVEPRGKSRLMVLSRADGKVEHGRFSELASYLKAGDALVLNNSRVIPARHTGKKVDTGGRVEILLLRRFNTGVWEALVRPGKRVTIGTRIKIGSDSVAGSSQEEPKVIAEVAELRPGGIKVISFSDEKLLPKLGKIPLPPYIHTPLHRPERYQTVYAKVAGSVAAPTAGLHFAPELLGELEQKGVECLFVTLHIGLDTFRPVKEDDPLRHPIYREYGVLSREVAAKLSQAKGEGRRIICVGTSTVRLIEQAAQASKTPDIEPFEGWVSLFILPGYQFRMVDALITNFHLPKSTLLMLVTAFAGKDLLKLAYNEAIASGYHFYSFGDAMLIL